MALQSGPYGRGDPEEQSLRLLSSYVFTCFLMRESSQQTGDSIFLLLYFFLAVWDLQHENDGKVCVYVCARGRAHPCHFAV